MTLVSFVLLTLCAVSLAYLLLQSAQLHRAKPADLGWRGIIKLVSVKGVPAGLAPVYSRWFRAFWIFFAAVCISVACAVWGGDHSFLVVIFPLLFYYFFARFFLWEKEDLTD